ncbi:TetR/AcrR family transcriptional regulator [soil metagenome]
MPASRRISKPASKSVATVVARPRQRVATPGTDLKREHILEVAERLFFEQGYARTSIEQIVRELGVTKPFVYYYFHDKQQIFETLAWRPAVACFTAMDFADDDLRPAHIKVQEGVAKLIGATVEHYPAAFLAYKDPQSFRPEYLAAEKKLAGHFYDRLCALLEEGKREGKLHFTEAKLTALATCSLPGFMYTWYRPDGRLPPEAIVRELTQMAVRVLGLRGASPRKR